MNRNRLSSATSSYLKTASEQPIHWYEWSNEAFSDALKLDRPILLDIGAVWCHWCHVMDRESYDNLEIAKIINENFIAIKVDRDERPDIDSRYQKLVSVSGNGGGWPLTCYLTPEGNLIYGGTYFPPESSGGRIGMKPLLKEILKAYSSDKAKINHRYSELINFISERETQYSTSTNSLSAQVEKTVEDIIARHDPVNGGFGSAPKFPNSPALNLLLTYSHIRNDKTFLNIGQMSLERMASGGIRDQLDGGFHRYSVDEKWRVPHFEKMVGENLELLNNYLLCYKLTRQDYFKEIAEGIIHFIIAKMINPETGAVYSSQDADISPEDDGSYYTWTQKEIDSILNDTQNKIINLFYGIKKSPNFIHQAPQMNTLARTKSISELATQLNLSEDEIKRELNNAKLILLTHRDKRQTPFIDKTIYSDLNGMLISSFAEAYSILNQEELKVHALKTLDFIIQKMYVTEKGFAHSFAEKSVKTFNLLNDQAQMLQALLAGFSLTTDSKYLQIAYELSDLIINEYEDKENGGFYDRVPQHNEPQIMKLEQITYNDAALSAPVSSLLSSFDKLLFLSGKDKFHKVKERTLKAILQKTSPDIAHASIVNQLYLSLNPQPNIILIGDPKNDKTIQLSKAASELDTYANAVYLFNPTKLKSDSIPQILKGKLGPFSENRPVAFVCSNTACALPSYSPAELKETYESF